MEFVDIPISAHNVFISIPIYTNSPVVFVPELELLTRRVVVGSQVTLCCCSLTRKKPVDVGKCITVTYIHTSGHTDGSAVAPGHRDEEKKKATTARIRSRQEFRTLYWASFSFTPSLHVWYYTSETLLPSFFVVKYG